MALLSDEITGVIINAYYVVYNLLPRGLTEVLYQRALAIELAEYGLEIERERPFEVRYRDQCIGIYRADLVVNGFVLIETKCAERLGQVHREQVTRYLRVSGLPIGLLFNFGDRAEVRRILP